jgi:hypothetical protein
MITAESPPLATLLPHGLLLDPAHGTVLLSTPKRGTRTLALGCVWQIQPRNCEVLDESACAHLARRHENVLRALPVGAALQVGLTIAPTTQAGAWEAQRQVCPPSPLLAAQTQAIRTGLPHQSARVQGRLRDVQTWVSLRIPVPTLGGGIAARLQTLVSLPSRGSQALAARFAAHLADQLSTFAGLRANLETVLRAAGHGVTLATGEGVGALLAASLDPGDAVPPVIDPAQPLGEQVLRHALQVTEGGWQRDSAQAAQVLSLHRAPPRTYPGILSAPRAPQGAEPLALWDAWDGPLSLVVNVAASDQAQERAQLRTKSTMAFLQRFNPLGDTSPEHAALKTELDSLLTSFFLGGGQLLSARVHVVLWGAQAGLAAGTASVMQAGRTLDLEFLPEPALGSTLFLQTLPLGFDPAYPREQFLRRARRLPGENVAHLLPLYGGFRGTSSASILYLNRRGETVAFDPFDNPTNPHMLVTGMSGSGKSFTMAHFLNQVLPLGASAVILDRLPSYQELCADWDGTYLALDFNDPICFNPFYGSLDAEHVAFLTASLAEMVSGGFERLNRESLSVLADALAFFVHGWALERGEPTLGLFVDEVLKEGSFAENDDDARQIGKTLARKLSMFHGRGAYAGFFDGGNQLQLDPTLTVIELSKLKEAPDLQGSLLFALMHLLSVFFAAPERLRQRKLFIIDETWALLKHPATADVIEDIGRTYRKLHTSAIFLSQQAEDFNSPAGRVLRKNSPTTLMLQQEPEELAEMQMLLKLTDAEHALLQGVQRHEGWSSAYLRLPSHTGGLIHLVPDGYTRVLVGQDAPARTLRSQQVAAHGGDLHAAMAALVREGAL